MKSILFLWQQLPYKSFEIRINLPFYLTHQNHNWKDVKQNSTLFACLLFAAQLSSYIQKNFLNVCCEQQEQPFHLVNKCNLTTIQKWKRSRQSIYMLKYQFTKYIRIAPSDSIERKNRIRRIDWIMWRNEIILYCQLAVNF